jgi:hypothetical protein
MYGSADYQISIHFSSPYSFNSRLGSLHVKVSTISDSVTNIVFCATGCGIGTASLGSSLSAIFPDCQQGRFKAQLLQRPGASWPCEEDSDASANSEKVSAGIR